MNTIESLESRGDIPVRNWDKTPTTFALCYSQPPPTADLTPPYMVFLDLTFLQATVKSGCMGAWLCLHYLLVYL